MTPAQLDLVVARTGHDRYRWLTSEANPDATQREGYRRVVEALADAPAPADSTADDDALAEELDLLERARACARKAPAACACRYGSCTRLGREVAPADCLACLRAGDDAGAAPTAGQPSAGDGR